MEKLTIIEIVKMILVILGTSSVLTYFWHYKAKKAEKTRKSEEIRKTEDLQKSEEIRKEKTIREDKTDRKAERIIENVQTFGIASTDHANETKENMIDEYCQLCETLQQYEYSDIYRKQFINQLPLYQKLFGLERHLSKIPETDFWIREKLSAIFNNQKVQPVEPLSQEKIDKTALRSCCRELSEQQLEEELNKLKFRILEYKGGLKYETLQKETERILDNIRLSIKDDRIEQDLALVGEMFAEIHRIFEANGCYVKFYDDPDIISDEKLRVEFVPAEYIDMELPGIYVRGKVRQRLCLLASCAGTRRKTYERA